MATITTTRKPRKTAAEAAAERRINQACQRACYGAQVNIMDLGKIVATARALLANGADDAGLAAGLAAFVETIRVR